MELERLGYVQTPYSWFPYWPFFTEPLTAFSFVLALFSSRALILLNGASSKPWSDWTYSSGRQINNDKKLSEGLHANATLNFFKMSNISSGEIKTAQVYIGNAQETQNDCDEWVNLQYMF